MEIAKAERPFKVQKVEDRLNSIKILIFGGPGVGKTRLAGSACSVPSMSPTMAFDIDNGMLSLAGEGHEDLDLVPVTSFSSGEDNFVKPKDFIVENPTVYRACIIDNVTELQDLVMREKLHKARKEDPDINLYGQTASTLGTVIRQIRDLPIHVIAIASEAVIVKPDGTHRYVPNLSGKLASSLPGFFDIVARMTSFRGKDGQIHRGLEFVDDGTVAAKDRTDSLGETMVDPTMTKVFDLVALKHNLGV